MSVNPLAAQTQADRDLVALVFEGLVTLDPAGAPRPALARSWTTSADDASWTFQLRPDARWHDGEPVTADDVVFTIETLQDPDYHGPGAGSWTGITATAVGQLGVRFDLDQPFGGFVDLLTQPIAPAHLLGSVPVADLPDDPFGSEPIGSGAFAVTHLDRDHAILAPASTVGPPGQESPSPSASIDPLATLAPTPRTGAVEPAIGRIELRFFDDAAALAAAFRAGQLDAASGLDSATAGGLADVTGARLIREPSSTLTAIALNLRPTHPELSAPATRRGLLQAIDRSRIGTVAYGGLAAAAEGLIPPTSWAFDASASPAVERNLAAAAKTLTGAGWTKAKDGWHASSAPSADDAGAVGAGPCVESGPVRRRVAGRRRLARARVLGQPRRGRPGRARRRAAADRHVHGGCRSGVALATTRISIRSWPRRRRRPAARTSSAFRIRRSTTCSRRPARPAPQVARKVAFAAVQKRLAEGMYVLPIAWPDTVVAISNRVQGTANRPVSDGSERFWDVLDWRLADDR